MKLFGKKKSTPVKKGASREFEVFMEPAKQSDEDIYRFSNRLNKMGVDEKLREAGAQDGDKVRILDFYFDFFNVFTSSY